MSNAQQLLELALLLGQPQMTETERQGALATVRKLAEESGRDPQDKDEMVKRANEDAPARTADPIRPELDRRLGQLVIRAHELRAELTETEHQIAWLRRLGATAEVSTYFSRDLSANRQTETVMRRKSIIREALAEKPCGPGELHSRLTDELGTDEAGSLPALQDLLKRDSDFVRIARGQYGLADPDTVADSPNGHGR